ncbi:MAG: hypothetical protein CFE26_02220 [Verrucomicrobiales bacterium VVV1]|nr:MAG: hypothetical protein CFE26_02220 [Verrucomicrobiales bacterium VVV1]
MKPLKARSLLTAVVVFTAGSLPGFAVDVIKGDNTNGLNLGTSWALGTAPGTGDVATWSGTYNTAGSLSSSFSASSPVSWQGIKIGSLSGTAAGLVSIGGTGTAVAGSQVTIGSSGIDMSAANQNLVINAATTVLSGSTQTWTVASGRNLRFGNTGTGGANANLDGTAGTVITVTGGGVVDANQGGVSGFSDAAGFAGFNGKWIVDSNTTLRGLRNGATAWGTSTASDAIKLNGGTLATGGISGAVGNWTWNTNINVAASSIIDNQNISGSSRYLKLNGVLSGSANLAFASTGVATMSADTGFILTNANTLSGQVTINSGVFVRVGGLGGTDTTTAVGSTGDLGTASIVNNGTLTLSRDNTWTFANDVSGTGVLRIGVTTGSATHIVTVSGNNSHSGGTTLQSAVTLKVGSATALGTGALTIAGNGIFDNATGSSLTVSNGLTMSGGSPTFTGTNDMTFSGASQMAGSNRTVTVSAGTLTLAGGLGQDASARGLTKAGSGTLVLSGASTYTGTTTISSGSLQIAGSAGTLGSGAITNSANLTFNRSNSIDVGNAIGGTGSVSQIGGTTTLSGISNYSGSTSVSAGTLLITGTLGNTATSVTGGTLGGNGIVGGSVSIGSSGTLSVGATTADSSIGTLKLGGLTMSGLWQVGATGNGVNDLVDLGSGSLSVGGTIAFITSGYTVAFNDSFDLATFGGTISGTPIFDFSGASTQAYGMWDTSAFASTGVITYVPETHAALLGSIGLMCLLRRRRA